MVESICVYCGSNPGFDPAFRAAAVSLGTEIGRRGIRLVYGGSHLGMMGVLADAVLAAGGQVTGVRSGRSGSYGRSGGGWFGG